jgi:F0F1-type ATP synthase delta subunit
MKPAYIRAVREKLLSGENTETVIAGLKSALAKKGHGRLLGSILRGALRELEHDVVAKAPQLVVAKADEATLSKAKAALANLGGGETLSPVVKADDTLIGGFIVKASGKQVDASYKRALLEMYRKVVS